MNAQMNIAENQEKFIIHVDPQIAKIVLPFDRKEMAEAYLTMFTGFTWRNWTNKYSLGRAWQTALAQCGAFCDTKNKQNPAAKYLTNVYDAHKKYWSRVIMTHGARDNLINPDDQEIKKLRAHGERMIREAMDKINLILARYNERTEELIATQSKEKAQMHTSAMPQAMAQVATQPAMAMAQTAPAQAQSEHQPGVAPAQAPMHALPQAPQQVAQNSVKSVAQPAQQSGAFAMVRDTVKKPTTAIADKPVEVPTVVAKPAQAKPIEKKQEQPEVKPVVAQKQKPIVHHMPKAVVAPVKKSGALPAVRDNVKRQNIVKSEEKVKEFQVAQKRVEISAKQRAQLQIEFQRRIQMWQIGQFKQNAA
ncbi:MAG: hypothetical protein E7007_03455 [Alphaproteobacteria bacterium]|nr:hypothetical protein [Alphaproteobacteria bacterium]